MKNHTLQSSTITLSDSLKYHLLIVPFKQSLLQQIKRESAINPSPDSLNVLLGVGDSSLNRFLNVSSALMAQFIKSTVLFQGRSGLDGAGRQGECERRINMCSHVIHLVVPA